MNSHAITAAHYFNKMHVCVIALVYKLALSSRIRTSVGEIVG